MQLKSRNGKAVLSISATEEKHLKRAIEVLNDPLIVYLKEARDAAENARSAIADFTAAVLNNNLTVTE